VIVWTTGTASGGNADDGLGGTPAQVSDRLRVEWSFLETNFKGTSNLKFNLQKNV